LSIVAPAVLVLNSRSAGSVGDFGVACRSRPAGVAFLDCHGVKIHYVVQGAGEPGILIHGLYSSANINWQLTGVFGELAKDHRLVALDLPGHSGPAAIGSHLWATAGRGQPRWHHPRHIWR
jgi:pimeloyl-ACP methyl ester carboxylesterase